jgi:hypothetical protein
MEHPTASAAQVKAARDRALQILTPNERALAKLACERLQLIKDERNLQQHPHPDLHTLKTYIEPLIANQPHAQGLRQVLDTMVPIRMKRDRNETVADLLLVTPVGQYTITSSLREEIAKIEGKLVALGAVP